MAMFSGWLESGICEIIVSAVPPNPTPWKDVNVSGGRCDWDRADYATQWSAGELCLHPQWISRRENKDDAYFWGMCYRDVFVRNNLESDFLLCPCGSIKPTAVLDTTKTIFDHAGCFWQEPCEFWCQVVALGTLGP